MRSTELDNTSLEARARRRVRRKIGFGIHALVFVVAGAMRTGVIERHDDARIVPPSQLILLEGADAGTANGEVDAGPHGIRLHQGRHAPHRSASRDH